MNDWRSELLEVTTKLLDGKEAFLIWADIISREQAKEKLSRWASRILGALNSILSNSYCKIVDVKTKEQRDDIRAKILLDLGDLCLEHNLLSISATKSCLIVACRDIGDYLGTDLEAHKELVSSNVRCSMALGILIAKLSCRLKYSKQYEDHDSIFEESVAKKLKTL